MFKNNLCYSWLVHVFNASRKLNFRQENQACQLRKQYLLQDIYTAIFILIAPSGSYPSKVKSSYLKSSMSVTCGFKEREGNGFGMRRS